LELSFRQKKGGKGDPARHVGCRSHIETRCGGLFIQFGHSSVLHRPFDGQIKHFKGTEANKAVHCIIQAGFVVCILRLSSIFRTQGSGEIELGTGVPHDFQGNIIMMLKIVGIWRDNEYGILLKETQYFRYIPSYDHLIIQYIEYIQVYYSISER
jgi:hypothetical protein